MSRVEIMRQGRRGALEKRLLGAMFCIVSTAAGQLNQNCVVSVLNRTAQVNADGSWVLPNVPANFGLVRARATCVNNGITTFGQSALFSLAANGVVNLPHVQLGNNSPIPTSVSITAPGTTLNTAGATVQLSVTASYASGPSQDITQASTGTQYNISNSAIATISANGLVTAVSTGTVVVQAVNEGTAGIISIQVVLAGVSHGGIPDSWAIAHGLDPNDPAMPAEDPDHDGLTNLQEFQAGTDPQNPDTDGDGLTDGQEVLLYHTSPLLASSDGSGIPDGIEVQTGTLGGSLASKLSKALSSLSVTPTTFVLDVNSIQGLASQQLTVTGNLIDGKTTVDLTSTATGTNYSSSDLTICNFGSPDGNVFAGNSGPCTVTITNNGFKTTASVTVNSFTPTDLSFVSIPGFANGVAVNGNYAYVAAGAAGLQVVSVSSRTSPSIVASLSLGGNSNGIRLLGNLAYIAGGSAGLQVVDVTNPLAPVLRGTLSTGGNALNLAVYGNTAYVANGSNLFLANVTNPAAMMQIGTLALSGTIQGVDVDPAHKLAVVAAGPAGIYVVDLSNPAAPVLVGSTSTGDARQVAIRSPYAFVADYDNSTTSVNIATPAAPAVLSHITDPNLGGFLQDIVLSGSFALGADVKFFNGIPITDISNPLQLLSRAILNFTQRDDNGMGIAADGNYAYLVTEHSNLNKFGTSGDSRLYIGQYLALQDLKGIPPTASITSPAVGSTVIQGSILPITVNATDDVAVGAVNFLVNGQVVFTATAAPYQFNYAVPTGITSLTLGATAVDLGANVGTATSVTVNVIPDPGTTAQGHVVDTSNNPVASATVVCSGVSGISASDGSFSIASVPTVSGVVACIASATSAGLALSGAASAIPVPGGTTSVGNIVISGGTPLTYLAGSSFADLSSVFDSTVKPTLPPPSSFIPTNSGVVFTGNYLQIGVNAQGSLVYNGVGLQFDPTGHGGPFKPDVIYQGTVRDVYGIRFNYGASSFFGYGGCNNSQNDGNVTVASFGVYQDPTINAARSVTQYGPLQVTTVTTLRPNDRYVNIDVVITNTGTGPISNLLFSRSVDFDVEVPVNGFTNFFDVFTSPGGGTIIGAGALSLPEYYGLGTAATFAVADGETFAYFDPSVFRNLDPNGTAFDSSASFVFSVASIDPGSSVHLTSKR